MKPLALPARVLVPLLLMAGALAVAVVNNLLQVREYRKLVEHEQSQILAERLGIEQAGLDVNIVNGNVPQLRRTVMELALKPNLTHAFLIEPGGRIVGSLARTDLGRALTDPAMAPVGDALFELHGRPDQTLQVSRAADGRALQAVLMLNAGYRLLVQADLEQPFAQRMYASRLELWRHGAMIVLSAGLLAVFLHLLWFRRARALADAARCIGAGRLDTRLDLGGRDELTQVGLAFNDMALRLQTQHAALRESEARLRAIFEQAGVGVARISSRDGQFVELNAKCSQITGYAADELLTRTLESLIHPEDRAAERVRLAILLGGSLPEYTADFRLLHSDGHVVHVTCSVTPMSGPAGAPEHHIVVLQDITARVLAEQALTQERNRLEAAERIGGMGSWEFYPILGRGWWSQQMYALFGLDPAAGSPDLERYIDAVHPDDREKVALAMRHMSEGARTFTPMLYRTSPASGAVRHLRPSVQIVTDDEGHVIKYVGTVLDVTRQVAAEAALRASEERLRATLENAPNVAVQWFDRDGRVLYWNHAAAALYGWTADEAIGRLVGQFVMSDNEAAAFVATLQRIGRERICIGPVEYPVRHRSGQTRQVEASTFSIPGPQGEAIFVCMGVDVTARRAAEMAVEKERTYLRTLFSALPDYVWVKSVDGRYLTCNRMIERFFGLTEPDLVGRTDYDFFSTEQADLFRAEDEAILRSGERGVHEAWVTSATTGERIRVQTIKVPMRDDAGVAIGVLGMGRDITELRETQDQLRTLNAELEQRVTERTQALTSAMKELESFSYAVSHDLKAPLRGIDGYSRILQEDYGDRLDDQARRFLDNIRNGAAQMHALIEDLLAYSRMERRALESNRVDLGELVHSVLTRRADEIRNASARIDGDVPTGLVVRADRQGLDLVLRNLLDNALKFSRDANPPVITLSARTGNDCIELSIRDNGIGFDMKYHERIFEIFQRLHRSDEFAGTGVGLALVRKAMQRMGGRVWAESAPGEGACFHLEFPA